MTRRTVYTMDRSGKVTSMRPSAPRSENFMQELVAAYPEIISEEDGGLLLVRREQPIGESDASGGRWSLDHLFVTKGAVPVLVELKRAVDTRLRREVVGQMLDYAANGTAYWQSGRIAESFARSMDDMDRDPDSELASFIGERDPIEFWDQVDANFAAGRIRIVFVADEIPFELARIVEFLNEQMKADVRAIQLSWFESSGGETALVPVVIGATQRAADEKASRSALPPIAREEWIEERLRPVGNAIVEAAGNFIRVVENLGGRAVVPSTQGSLIAVFKSEQGQLFPMSITQYSNGSAQFCLGYLMNRPTFAEERVRRALYEELVAITGPLSTATLSGFPSFDARLFNDPVKRKNVSEFLAQIIAMADKFATAAGDIPLAE